MVTCGGFKQEKPGCCCICCAGLSAWYQGRWHWAGLVGFGMSALASVVSLQVETFLSKHCQLLLHWEECNLMNTSSRAQLTGAD